jgi:glycosyltransferase involved in cell wall biosynthesis
MLVVVGVVGDLRLVVVVGASLLGIATTLVAKLVLELRTESARRASREVVELVEARVSLLERSDQRVRNDVDRLAEQAGLLSDEVVRLSADAARAMSRVEQLLRDVQGQMADARTTRAGLASLRTILDKVAVRVPTAAGAERLATLSRTNVVDPLLSVAIPSFNRPAALRECLQSLETELERVPSGVVEICITDDVSTDPETLEIAADFAERYRFASVRRHASNVGLERNILAACEPCRGEYVLIMGNDDKFVPGAMEIVLADLRRSSPSVYLLERLRMHADGSPHPPVPGTDPVEIQPGDAYQFDSLLAATRRRGFLSTLGFISHVVFRRAPFVLVDSSRYLDLTLYSRVFVLIEAFASAPLLFRNEPVVVHRTPTTAQKHGESMGRGEEVFMSGGRARAARYFGITYAAALQRLVDRGVVDYAYFADLPEQLMTPTSLVTWITANRAIDPDLEMNLDSEVVADGDRFLAAVGSDTRASELRAVAPPYKSLGSGRSVSMP